MELGVPLVSVIIATYNRSESLFYAISSVLHSAFTNWELLVVGDACTDDTEAVVRSFEDPRIRFFNLEKNFGDQGGPNNEGFRRAKGRYIAYLSHDDLWMPNHLETALNSIEVEKADFVTTLGISVKKDGQNIIFGTLTRGRFVLDIWIPASLWLLKREVLEEIGPWKHPRECFVAPSQDVLLRAWKAGKRICTIPKVSVIAFHASFRPGIYKTRESDEIKLYFERMQHEPDFLEKELLKVVCHQTLKDSELEIWVHLRRSIFNIMKRSAIKIGITPMELAYFLHYRKKGKFINRWRKKAGLPELK